jgi:hypothetical protein
MNAKENSMKIIFIIPLLISATAPKTHAEQYSFAVELSYHGQYEFMINVKFKNPTNQAMCLRSNDYEFRHIGDFLLTENDQYKQLKFIGEKDDSKSLMWPESYVIVPPNEERLSSFYLNYSYKITGKNFTIKYALPIIPCKILLNKSVKIPPVSRIKTKSGQEIEATQDAYPDWFAEGFIATSEPLRIKLK